MPLSRDTTLNVVAAGDPLDRFSTEGEPKIRSETPKSAGSLLGKMLDVPTESVTRILGKLI